jgi:ferritin-like metal-binding protein YciE
MEPSGREAMARYAPREVMRRYLQDAIAAEINYENHLRQFAADARREPGLREIFLQHAEETRRQAAWLRMRLDTLHGVPSGVKALRAQLAWIGPKVAQLGHDGAERVSQDLLTAFTIECSEIAMYEALAVAAATAGDSETERLARGIQKEERRMADRLWAYLDTAVRESVVRLVGEEGVRQAEAVPTLSAAFPGTSEMPEYPGPTVSSANDEATLSRIAAFMYDGDEESDGKGHGAAPAAARPPEVHVYTPTHPPMHGQPVPEGPVEREGGLPAPGLKNAA